MLITRSSRQTTAERLYHAALAWPADERTPFLAKAFADHEERRCDVESRLAS